MSTLETTRKHVATKVRDLRRQRGWAQKELADRIGISQNWLSELERGDGSFTAEQFLTILAIFNVGAEDFAPSSPRDAALMNSLARLGATHLLVNSTELPSSELRDVHRVIAEALVDGTPRIVTAAAVVLAAHGATINFGKIASQLSELGLERRVPWLVQSTLNALDGLTNPSKKLTKHVSRIRFRLLNFLGHSLDLADPAREDILDSAIRSEKTLDELRRLRSAASKQWGVVTALQTKDFVEAIEAADVDR